MVRASGRTVRAYAWTLRASGLTVRAYVWTVRASGLTVRASGRMFAVAGVFGWMLQGVSGRMLRAYLGGCYGCIWVDVTGRIRADVAG
eukprot:5511931-Pyramimonas_sp.AAC.1